MRLLLIGYAESMFDLVKMSEVKEQVQSNILHYSKAGSPMFNSTLPIYYDIIH